MCSLSVTSSNRLVLGNVWFTRALYPNTRSMDALILLVPSAFSTQGLKALYFSRLKKYQPSAGKKGGIVGTTAFYAQTHYSIGPAPAQTHCLDRLMKQPKAAHYTKTTREPTRQGNPKTRVGSRVPPAGHLTTYGKIRNVYIYS